MSITPQFKAGDIVCVRDEETGEMSEPVAVRGVYATSGGLRLDHEVFGYASWNERDCVLSENRAA
jgi:hypothetical protein